MAVVSFSDLSWIIVLVDSFLPAFFVDIFLPENFLSLMLKAITFLTSILVEKVFRKHLLGLNGWKAGVNNDRGLEWFPQ